MATEESGPGPAAPPGLLASLRSLAASATAILRTRLDLLATEVEEARVRIARLLFWGVLALVFLSVGLVMFTLLIVVLFWDTYRITVVALLAVGYSALGLGIALWVRANLRSGPKLFAASVSELAKDQEQLTSRDVQ